MNPSVPTAPGSPRPSSDADRTRPAPYATVESPRIPAPLQVRDPERYAIVAEHGRGGLGRVVRARDRELDRSVAIKELLVPTADSELRFFREAMITARLEHPNIVPVHEAGRWPDGTPFYAMKLVAGRPLSAVIADTATLEQRLGLVRHAIAVADAIAYAHARGIIHRDLKPSNVIVGEYGETIVIDWGLAKDLAEPETIADTTPHFDTRSDLTRTGSALGTPAYMPPEQARGTADQRSDIYALGALLHHVLHGAPPDADAATPQPAGIPPALAAVVAKAMARDPDARYQTARELADELHRFQGGSLVRAHRYSLGELVRRWATRHRTVLALVATALLVLAVVLAVSARRVVDERDRAEAARDDLVLSNARHAVEADPTRALLWIRRYVGRDATAAQDIAAAALARGAARYVLTEHTDAIKSLIAVDDHTLYAASTDSVREWRLDGPRVSSTVLATNLIAVPVFDRHRGRLAFAAGDAIVVRERSGHTRTLPAMDGHVERLHLADRGRWLLAVGRGAVHAYDLDTPASAPLSVDSAGVRGVAVVGGDLLIASATGDVQRWSLTQRQRTARRQMPPITALVAAADTVLIVQADATAVVMAADLSPLRTVSLRSACELRAVSADISMVALACPTETLVVSTATGEVLLEYPHDVRPDVTTFSDDGAHLGIGHPNGSVTVVSTGTWARRDLRGHRAMITANVAFVGDLVVSGDDHGEIRVWPLPSSTPATLAGSGALRRVAASADGRWFATDSADGVVRIWHPEGRLARETQTHQGMIVGVTFSADDRLVLTPGWDSTLGVTPVDAASPPRQLRGHTDRLTAVARWRTGAVTVSTDDTLRRWELDRGTSTVLLTATADLMLVDASGDHVATAGDAGIVYEVDAVTGDVVEVAHHRGPVSHLRYSQDGRWLVSGGQDGRVLLRDRSTSRVHELSLGGSILVLAISADARFVAVATEDPIVHIYQLAEGGPRLRETREASVKRMRFSSVGQRLAVVSTDGLLRVWDLASGTSSAIPLSDDPPIGVAWSAEAIATTTTGRFTVHPFAATDRAPRDLRALRALIDRHVRVVQRPRRADADARLLFDHPSL